MRNRKTILVFLLLSLNSIYANTQNDGSFKLVKQNDVVSLYERWFVNANGEHVRELKAVFTVQSSISKITSLLADARKGTEWNMNAKEYKIHATGTSWITYTRYGVPWPFGDQDCCLRYSIKNYPVNNEYAEIDFESTQHENYPVQKGITRITGAKGKWQMHALGKQGVKITYMVSSNRNTKLPRWISDPVIHNNIFNTMAAFKSLLEK